jgi:hypothetical protein
VSERLPDDLSTLDAPAIAKERIERDRRLTQLFRRWGKFDRREARELRHVHDERVRLARYIGLRRRKPPNDRPGA